MLEVKYPNIKVSLVGSGGNTFAVLWKVRVALKKAKVPPEEIKAFMEEATSGNYNELLNTCTKWVEVV